MKKNLKNIVRNISLLAKSNRLTGIWDNIRFQECKKEFNSTNLELVYLSEKKGRKSVENRGKARSNLDESLKKIFN
tara:strand:+ start:527 stop:754 length:228 start_codon:yes stop_codon:yes gene_type:complete